ncbi:MAG: hypothetical protein K0Q47_119 [Sedimentibacter sp.]|jgi:hypothetical protein|nr:hypothetical protein [Sedimentibacter sp.]
MGEVIIGSKTKKVIKRSDSTIEKEEKDWDEVTPEDEYHYYQTDLDNEDLDAPVTKFGFLTKDLNNLDIEDIYKHLKKNMKVGKDRLDPDVLSEAIDSAPEWSFKATQIYLIAKERLAKFNDLTFKVKYADLSNKASDELEKMRKDKKLNGQITKEKIENWIVANVPEYKKLLREKRELETAVELLKSLAAQFESKKSMLQTQGRLAEKKKFVVTPKGGEKNREEED